MLFASYWSSFHLLVICWAVISVACMSCADQGWSLVRRSDEALAVSWAFVAFYINVLLYA